MCFDCPPVGYPTDRTRCAGCPRAIEEIVDKAVRGFQADLNRIVGKHYDPEGAPYGSDRFVFAAPGDQQHDMWLLRFDDAERGDMVFCATTYDDPEASAWEAWSRAAPTFNCRLFRTAMLTSPAGPVK